MVLFPMVGRSGSRNPSGGSMAAVCKVSLPVPSGFCFRLSFVLLELVVTLQQP
eukprot:Gb_13455 [translate_table: standard]